MGILACYRGLMFVFPLSLFLYSSVCLVFVVVLYVLWFIYACVCVSCDFVLFC